MTDIKNRCVPSHCETECLNKQLRPHVPNDESIPRSEIMIFWFSFTISLLVIFHFFTWILEICCTRQLYCYWDIFMLIRIQHRFLVQFQEMKSSKIKLISLTNSPMKIAHQSIDGCIANCVSVYECVEEFLMSKKIRLPMW